MDVQPQEGHDYIVDLYQVVGVPQAAGDDDIAHAINARLKQYHPDRLQGLAPEFQAKGERMARLLNRSRIILLNNAKRSEYDAILSEWDGPVSNDGTPAIRMDDVLRISMAGKTIEDIEAMFADQRKQATEVTKYDPRQQAMLGRMLAVAEGQDAQDLRDAYDSALLAEDQLLAIEEAERGQLLGLKGNKRYEVGAGYGDTVSLAIDKARTMQIEAYNHHVLGEVGIRLAILAGETPQEAQPSTLEPQHALPLYFEPMAQKIADIAARREALLQKRLEIFEPTYPIAELQAEPKPYFAIGIATDAADKISAWIGFHFDSDAVELSNITVPDHIQALLTDGKYEQAYNAGFNILTFVTKDHIELNTLLQEAYNKHIQKYFPGSLM